MSNTPAPVRRRDSPWGLLEGDTRQLTPHRCNDTAEDVIQVYLVYIYIIFFCHLFLFFLLNGPISILLILLIFGFFITPTMIFVKVAMRFMQSFCAGIAIGLYCVNDVVCYCKLRCFEKSTSEWFSSYAYLFFFVSFCMFLSWDVV